MSTGGPLLAGRGRPNLDPARIRCHNGNLLVRLLDAEQTAGGIYIPDTAKNDMQRMRGAVVESVGEGRITAEGSAVKPRVRCGDHVWLQANCRNVTGFHPDMFGDAEQWLLVREEDVACVFTPESTPAVNQPDRLRAALS